MATRFTRGGLVLRATLPSVALSGKSGLPPERVLVVLLTHGGKWTARRIAKHIGNSPRPDVRRALLVLQRAGLVDREHTRHHTYWFATKPAAGIRSEEHTS